MIVFPNFIHLGFQFIDVAAQSMKGFYLQRLLHVWMSLLLQKLFVEIDILMGKAQ